MAVSADSPAMAITAILELLAFFVARKMLKPELVTLDIFLGVGTFVFLLAESKASAKPVNGREIPW